MTRQEIEEIIARNIRTNGRGEITARVMAGVLYDFLAYTDTLAEDFAALCNALADAFTVLVTQMEGDMEAANAELERKFETEAGVLEGRFEAFCTDLLENKFEPWAEGMEGRFQQLAEALLQRMGETKSAAQDAKGAANDAKTASGEAKEAVQGMRSDLNTLIRLSLNRAYAEKPVVFRDIDGTILHAYTVEDFMLLTEMPAGPTRNGLTFTGWNWTLANAKAYAQAHGGHEIGAMFETDNGKTRIVLEVFPGAVFGIYLSNGQSWNIDWGDGTTTTENDGSVTHAYQTGGRVVVEIESSNPGNEQVGISDNDSGSLLRELYIGSGVATFSKARMPYRLGILSIPNGVLGLGFDGFSHSVGLKHVTLPPSVSVVGSTNVFSSCTSLRSVSIPKEMTSFPDNCFGGTAIERIFLPDETTELASSFLSQNKHIRRLEFPAGLPLLRSYVISSCTCLEELRLPDGITEIPYYFANSCTSLREVDIPEGVTVIGSASFGSCLNLSRITIPAGVTQIDSYAFNISGVPLTVIMRGSVPPTLGSTVFSTSSSGLRILVPAAAVETYKAAAGWSEYANYIFANPE